MGNLTTKQASSSTKIVGSDQNGCESNYVEVTNNQEVTVYDAADNGAIDALITILAGATVELRVGGASKLERKYVMLQAKGNGITYGFSNPAVTFDAFRNQFFILPFGPNTITYITNNSVASRNVGIAELS